MPYIKNDLHRALFALLEIQRYLNENRVGDAHYDCDAALESFKDTEALAAAKHLVDQR